MATQRQDQPRRAPPPYWLGALVAPRGVRYSCLRQRSGPALSLTRPSGHGYKPEPGAADSVSPDKQKNIYKEDWLPPLSVAQISQCLQIKPAASAATACVVDRH